MGRLLEDLALVEISALDILALPLPVLSNLGLALLRLGIQFLPVIAGIINLPVLTQFEGKFLSLEDPDATDGGIVVLAEKTSRCKRVLLEFLQTLEHSSDEVARHEDHGQLVIVLVVASPDGVVLVVKVLPEPGNGRILVIVGVKPLPFLQIESSLW